MTRPLAIEIRIIEGGGVLAVGPGFANADGFTAKTGGLLRWLDVELLRMVEKRPGNVTAGALAGGGVGLLGGPGVALAGAVGGAVVACLTGGRSLYAMRIMIGSDVLFETAGRDGKALERHFASVNKGGKQSPAASSALPELIPPRELTVSAPTLQQRGQAALQDLRRRLPGRPGRNDREA
jgi:hypothetical protein